MGKTEKFTLPGDLLRELTREPHEKLINRDILDLSESENVADPIFRLSTLAGWNQTVSDLKILSKHAVQKMLAKVHYHQRIITVGSGMAVHTGANLDWIGMVLVHPDLRRQGIATGIMINCLEKLRSGNRNGIIGLDATPEGSPLYDHLGFNGSFGIQRILVSTKDKTPVTRSMNIDPVSDVREIITYAKDRGFTNSKHYLKIMMELSSRDSCFLTRNEGKVTGFVMSRPGRIRPFIGPLMADNDKTASGLFNQVYLSWQKSGQHEVFTDIPDIHCKNEEFSVFNEFRAKSLRSFIRMYHLISPEKVKRIKNNKKTGDSGKLTSLLSLMEASEGSYERTKAYMDDERNKWLKYLYATGGPEIG